MFGWLRRKGLPEQHDKGDELIWRSTAMFGDFRIRVCIHLMIYPAFWDLTAAELGKIVKRYREHVSHWNISMDTIGEELCMLAWASHFEPSTVSRMFDDLGGPMPDWQKALTRTTR